MVAGWRPRSRRAADRYSSSPSPPAARRPRTQKPRTEKEESESVWKSLTRRALRKARRPWVPTERWPGPSWPGWHVGVPLLLGGPPSAGHPRSEAPADTAVSVRPLPQAEPDTCDVLVVDDDPAILDTIAQALDFEGYRVATAANGMDALRRLDEQTP